MKTKLLKFKKELSICILFAVCNCLTLVSALVPAPTSLTFTSWTSTNLNAAYSTMSQAGKDSITQITVINTSLTVSPTEILGLKNDFTNLQVLDLSGVKFSGTTFGSIATTIAGVTTSTPIFGTGSANNTKDANTVKLVSISLPSNITSFPVGSGAFKNCPNLTTVILPASFTTLGWYTFYNCPKLTNINLQNTSLTTASDHVFAECTSLSTISFPSGLTTLPSNFFYNCTALSNVTLPSTCTSIGSSAFQNCTSLNSIILPTVCTSIGGSAFQGCSALNNVNIPTACTTIGSAVFQNCSSLVNLTLPSSLTSIGTGAFSFTGINTLVIPDGVSLLDNSMCQQATSLSTITLPNTPTITVNANVFTYQTGAGASIVRFDCPLTKVYCRAQTPPSIIGSGTLSTTSILSTCKLYVPAAAVTAYKNSINSPWSLFNDNNILSIESLTSAIDEISSNAVKLQIFPSVVMDHFSIQNIENVKKVEIVSMMGQIVRSFQQSLSSYTVSDLKAGNYLVKVYTQTTTEVGQIVKL